MTLADAQAQLAKWLAASLQVAKGQSYEISTDGSMRRLTRVDAAEIRQMIIFWEGRVADLTAAAASSANNGSQIIYAGRVC